MSVKKYSNADYRAAINRTAKKNMDRAAQAGRPVTFGEAKKVAADRARTYQKKHEK